MQSFNLRKHYWFLDCVLFESCVKCATFNTITTIFFSSFTTTIDCIVLRETVISSACLQCRLVGFFPVVLLIFAPFFFFLLYKSDKNTKMKQGWEAEKKNLWSLPSRSTIDPSKDNDRSSGFSASPARSAMEKHSSRWELCYIERWLCSALLPPLSALNDLWTLDSPCSYEHRQCSGFLASVFHLPCLIWPGLNALQ